MGHGGGPKKIPIMDKTIFFWDGMEPVYRILVVGTLGYIALVMILKISGKRTLAKMNAFDFIITVTIGSAFGRVLTAKSVGVVEAIIAFALLAFLQYIFAVLELRSKLFKKLVTNSPALLYYKGEFHERNLKEARLSKDELLGAARKKGYGTLKNVDVIILESDASFSIIGESKDGDGSTYHSVIKETPEI